MPNDMSFERFRALRAQATDVLALRGRAEQVLAARPLRSFDGFGHFLDAVLGEDHASEQAIAQTIRLSRAALEQLRASELDPFSGSLEPIVYLAFLLGIDQGEFVRLAKIDHVRFAHHADSVIPRSEQVADGSNISDIEQIWSRLEEDRASAL
jgi:hypothetical protein